MKQNWISRILLIFLVFGTLTSCSIFKNNKKSKNIEKVEEVKVVEQRETSKADVKVNQTDKQNDINTTTTETTTKETTKGSDIKVSIPRKDVKIGKEITVLDSLTGRKIIVLLDSLSQTLNIKVDGDTIIKETTTKTTQTSDKSKQSSKDSTDNSLKQVAINQRDEKDSYKKDVDNKSSVSILGIIGLFVGIVIAVVGIIVGLKKFVFKR